MSDAVFLTVVLAVLATNLGTVLALVWYFGGRIDRLDDQMQSLREDVAVLKATTR